MIMAIPEPIETFITRLGFDYTTLGPSATRPGARGDESPSVRTLVFISDGHPIMAVVPGACRADVERLRQAAHASDIRPARDDEIAAFYPESAPGTAPPLGPLYGQRVFVDEQLAHEHDVVFRAGTETDMVRMRYSDFAELVHPTIARFAVSDASRTRAR
jgi:Ala-tRNA(Pro) deacylase